MPKSTADLRWDLKVGELRKFFKGVSARKESASRWLLVTAFGATQSIELTG